MRHGKQKKLLCLAIAINCATLSMPFVSGGASNAVQSKPVNQKSQRAEILGRDFFNKIARSIKGKDFYAAQITPAFPKSWPPNGDGKICFYVNGYNIMGLADAARQSNIAARVVAHGDEFSVIPMSREIRDIGIESFYSADDEQMAIRESTIEVQNELIEISKSKSLPTADKSALLKKYFKLWKSTHSVLAKELKVEQHAFFDWLSSAK